MGREPARVGRVIPAGAPVTGARGRLTGVYALHPEEMLSHAISLTLQLGAALAGTPAGRVALRIVCTDAELTRRAARVVMRCMLRQVVGADPVTAGDIDRLQREVVALSRES